MNEWVTEKVPVTVKRVNEKGEVDDRVEMHEQKVMYLDPKPRSVLCKENEHEWTPFNIHTYDFACKKCVRHVIASPAYWKFENGKLIPR